MHGQTAMRRQAAIIRSVRHGFLAIGLVGLMGCSGGGSPAGNTPTATGAAAAGQGTSGDIMIGVGVALSGPNAIYGTDIVTGANIAIADINRKGGLLGRRLQVVTADDGCGIAGAEEAARKLVAANISLAIGHFCSVSTHAAAAIYAARNIIEITPASTATNITELAKLRHWTTLFRVINNDYEGGRFTARYFAQRYANRPVAFIHAADSYGVTTTRSFRAEMQSHGMAPSIDRSLAVDGAGLQDLVATLRQADVAAIFLVANADDAGAVLRAIRRAGIGADVYGSMAIEDAAFRPAAGNAADGTRFGMRAITIDDSLTPDLAAKYGRHVARRQSFVPAAYAAVQAWAAGVTRAHSLGGTAVATAMRQAPVDTAIGRLSWDEKGDLLTSLYGWYVWRGDTYQLDKTE